MPVGRVLLTTRQACPASTDTPSNRSPDEFGKRMIASMATSVSSPRRRAHLLFEFFVLAAAKNQITNIAEEPFLVLIVRFRRLAATEEWLGAS
jgi:hypothetical protein